MKQELMVFLAVFAIAAAMVPRTRREKNYCAPTTPCAWSLYGEKSHANPTVTNAYCICEDKKTCKVYEDNGSGSYEHRCM